MRVTSPVKIEQTNWQTTIVVTLGFWLSAIILLDWVIMPSLYLSGMMTTDSFASAGYSVFWIFNRLELITAGLALSGCFVLANRLLVSRLKIVAVVLLLGISLFETYFLTPQMSAIAINLQPLADVSLIPEGMSILHGLYWSLEVVKLVILGSLLQSFWRTEYQKTRQDKAVSY